MLGCHRRVSGEGGCPMTAADVATALGVNERTVRRAIHEGRLQATKIGRAFEVDLEEARRLFDSPGVAKSVYQDALAESLRLLRAFGHEEDALELERQFGLRYIEPVPGVVRA